MNFAQMLMQDVQPLPDTRDPARHKRKNTWTDVDKLHTARHLEAVGRYKEAVGPDWRKATIIAKRLGMSRDAIFKQLITYTEQGILEQRPAGGGEFNRRKGFEWRVK